MSKLFHTDFCIHCGAALYRYPDHNEWEYASCWEGREHRANTDPEDDYLWTEEDEDLFRVKLKLYLESTDR